MFELSPEEIAIIQQRREEKSAQEARVGFHKKAIATAYAFSVWSDENGLELTFSTFVNNFNYQEADGNTMYEAVNRIFSAAWPLQ
ncbi:hypothetical protein AAEH72_16005 [Shewanella xiamenensis]|jgi:hypothetical protein|uniref:hypothetical protein n=1 Tax=Shewanella TaxID=22 RepID=UPI000849EAA2|nr:hypothetical protein [Shewanella xiamenensis]MBW0298832.1 hypothetical protein [Shewanella xiamenensis]MCT8869313.1 hypothetical protein [Shewanella xiamenensis]MCT8873844.1 hypothetical protein [Shewanella xiamenensis]MCT8877503.1 hypothetical protein [Shewanella xiamenensis]ODR83773.1 hypothetical protein ABT47_23740 [Shewanella xiamenensis]